jgi:hypothetical protein
LCPVHLYARRSCSRRCAKARRVLIRLGADYREYWYDRARGIGVMPITEFERRYNMAAAKARARLPLWQAWGGVVP